MARFFTLLHSPVSDFVSGSVFSVRLEEASVKNRPGTYSRSAGLRWSWWNYECCRKWPWHSCQSWSVPAQLCLVEFCACRLLNIWSIITKITYTLLFFFSTILTMIWCKYINELDYFQFQNMDYIYLSYWYFNHYTNIILNNKKWHPNFVLTSYILNTYCWHCKLVLMGIL